MRKSIARRPKIRLIVQLLLIATVIFSFAVTNVPLLYAQDSGGKARAKGGRGQATGRRQYTPLTVAIKENLSPANVVSTKADVNFDKTMTDLMGKTRRIQIDKIELLKMGVRYYARIDGEPRDITYLQFRAKNAALVNIRGTMPEHNFYKHLYSTKGIKLTNGEYWAQNRLLAEITLPASGGQVAFSLPQKYIDDRSFILLWADPLHIKELSPWTAFGSSGAQAQREKKPPVDDSWWFLPIEIYLSCKLESKNIKTCDEGCGGEQQAEPSGILGASAGRICKDLGCIMCAGICCVPAKCSSETNPDPYLDYTFKAGN